MDAQGALDSLLGRLTTILVDEAQLLGRVRGDVEFIKDEMEFMNSLLLHLTEAQHRAHHVRTWMKQVTGLARDCEGNVELYVHYVGTASICKGIFGFFVKIARFLRIIRVRHQIATRIRELKVRTHDVGDRRQRYGVTIPELGMDANDDDNPWTHGGSHWRRLIFEDGVQKDEDSKQKCFNCLIKWLHEELPPYSSCLGQGRAPKVFAIPGSLAHDLAFDVYLNFSIEDLGSCYDITVHEHCRRKKQDARDILEIILGSMKVYGADVNKDDDLKQLAKKIQERLEGKRFLIFLQNVDTTKEEWLAALRTLSYADGCYGDIRIVITTDTYDKAKSLFPDTIHPCESYAKIVLDAAKKRDIGLMEQYRASYHKILDVLYPDDIFAMKMFQHLMFCYRDRIGHELEKYLKILGECKQQKKNIAEQMIMFCYNKLPSKYRSCLLYLTIFPKGHIIKARSLVRRWMSEGLLASNTTTDDTWMEKDEAMQYFKTLLNTGFLDPVGICDMVGLIKSCKVHDEVHKFICRTARDVNFVDSDLPLNLAHHLSIHNRMGLQQLHSDAESNSIVALLPTLAASPKWQLLKVLDLEDCKFLKKCHLKSICKILLLRYLSLRNTGITYLPKKIKELRCLETLDIRQTEIRVVSENAVVLPQLKHYLAGQKVRLSNDVRRPEKSFPTVRMPFCITRMKNLEILYHVHVANSDSELAGIGQLQKLRKLGVALHGENANLNHLFWEAEKLHSCLRSLSIQADRAASSYDPGEARLPCRIEEFRLLSKLTFCGTYLKESDIRILGRLHSLSCLWLRPRSYTESVLAFKSSEFRSLKALLVEGEEIINISFDSDTAPFLGSIVWSFATMEGISGLNDVLNLRKLELNGNCNLELIQRIKSHYLHLELTHNPHHQSQEDGTAAVASTSSAKQVLSYNLST